MALCDKHARHHQHHHKESTRSKSGSQSSNSAGASATHSTPRLLNASADRVPDWLGAAEVNALVTMLNAIIDLPSFDEDEETRERLRRGMASDEGRWTTWRWTRDDDDDDDEEY